MKAFGTLAPVDYDILRDILREAANKWARENGVGTLACEDWNVYEAIEEVPERALRRPRQPITGPL